MATGTFTLIDIPTKEPRRCWSLNPWKTRILLNYKGVDYKTEWVEYPDLRGRLEPFVPPNTDEMPFTSPAVQLPDGKYVMESRAIVDAIEKIHPEPSVHLDHPLQQPLLDILSRAKAVLEPVYKTRVPKRYLAERSRAYFERTRSEGLGMPLDQFEKENPLPVVFKKVAPVFAELNELLRKNPGPFILGEQVSYADFVLGGFLIFFTGQGDDVWDGLLESTGDRKLYEAYLEALSHWTKRNN